MIDPPNHAAKDCKSAAGLTASASIVTLTVLFLLPRSAHAYLDAGTGSMVIQALVAGVAAGLVILRAYWSRIKGFFGKKSAESTVDDTPPDAD